MTFLSMFFLHILKHVCMFCFGHIETLEILHLCFFTNLKFFYSMFIKYYFCCSFSGTEIISILDILVFSMSSMSPYLYFSVFFLSILYIEKNVLIFFLISLIVPSVTSIFLLSQSTNFYFTYYLCWSISIWLFLILSNSLLLHIFSLISNFSYYWV